MSLVALVAKKADSYGDRLYEPGETLAVPAIDAVVLLTRGTFAFASARTLKTTALAPAPAPTPSPAPEPPKTRRRRAYRRRDLVAED